MTYKEELGAIIDNSNFVIDSNNPYDMKILKALEKQIAKKPIVDEWERVKCANGHNIPVLSRNHNMPYCPFCGQYIDWRDYE